jgi:hypothetical protein
MMLYRHSERLQVRNHKFSEAFLFNLVPFLISYLLYNCENERFFYQCSGSAGSLGVWAGSAMFCTDPDPDPDILHLKR